MPDISEIPDNSKIPDNLEIPDISEIELLRKKLAEAEAKLKAAKNVAKKLNYDCK